MENLKNIYEDEIKLLQLFQNTIFYGLEFENEIYEIDNSKNFMKKKLNKKLKDGIEIICKETIYKKWLEKYLEIKIKTNKKDYEIYKIIVNVERIKLIFEKCESNVKKTISKQFGLNGYVIYKYNDNKNNYLLHQNVNNLLQYLEDYKEKNFCNVFKFENEEIKYVSKLPYSLSYDSIKNYKVIDSEDLMKLFKLENKKRIATNANEIKIKKETKKNIEGSISKIKLVYENTKDLYNIAIDNLLKISQIDEIMQKGTKKVEQESITENDNIYNNDISELELLKEQKLKLLEMKKTTDEIISKLQSILLN